MPIYSFQCEKCNRKLDIFYSKIGQDPRIWHFCPYCNKHTHMRALIGAAALRFKGEGFYKNDYKK